MRMLGYPSEHHGDTAFMDKSSICYVSGIGNIFTRMFILRLCRNGTYSLIRGLRCGHYYKVDTDVDLLASNVGSLSGYWRKPVKVAIITEINLPSHDGRLHHYWTSSEMYQSACRSQFRCHRGTMDGFLLYFYSSMTYTSPKSQSLTPTVDSGSSA